MSGATRLLRLALHLLHFGGFEAARDGLRLHSEELLPPVLERELLLEQLVGDLLPEQNIRNVQHMFEDE